MNNIKKIKMRHTKTPWKVSATGGLIVPDNDNPIATICRGFGRDEEEFHNWPANARRIVACVNSCEGMKTEELEKLQGGVWKDIFVDSLDKDVLIDELKTENARLLDGLKYSIRVVEAISALKTSGPIAKKLRSIIAEAEKKQ